MGSIVWEGDSAVLVMCWIVDGGGASRKSSKDEKSEGNLLVNIGIPLPHRGKGKGL